VTPKILRDSHTRVTACGWQLFEKWGIRQGGVCLPVYHSVVR